MEKSKTIEKEGSYKTSRHKKSDQGISAPQTMQGEDDYFERCSIINYVVIILGVIIFEVFCFQTRWFPFDNLGGPGRRLKYIAEHHMLTIRMGFLFTIVLHIFEAAYANFQCRQFNFSSKSTMKWTSQTFIVGYPSLRTLGEYCEKKKAAKKRF